MAGQLKIGYENNGTLALSTLASLDAIAQAFKVDASRQQGFRIAKLRLAVVLEGKTATEGPILWGVACNMNGA